MIRGEGSRSEGAEVDAEEEPRRKEKEVMQRVPTVESRRHVFPTEAVFVGNHENMNILPPPNTKNTPDGEDGRSSGVTRHIYNRLLIYDEAPPCWKRPGTEAPGLARFIL